VLRVLPSAASESCMPRAQGAEETHSVVCTGANRYMEALKFRVG